MENRLVEMEVFVRTVDRGSLTAAAAELGISAQMAGRYLRGLERRLGVVLLVRATRHQHLSEAGRAFLDRARGVLAAAQEAEDTARRFAARPMGALRVSAPVAYGCDFVAPRLAEFAQLYPEIAVDLRLADRVLDPVAEGFDVAIRIGDLPDSSLIARELPPYELVLCAAPSYLASRPGGAARDGAELHDWVEYRFPRHAPDDVWSWRRVEGPQATARRIVLHCDDSRAVCAAVAAGAGVAWLPAVLIRDRLASGALVSLPSARGERSRRMHLVYPERALAPAARAFVEWFLEAARR